MQLGVSNGVGMASIYLQITYVAHVIACFWYYLGVSNTFVNPDGSPSNWVAAFTSQAYSGIDKYGASIYVTLYTMLSIGYGDIHAVNNGYKA